MAKKPTLNNIYTSVKIAGVVIVTILALAAIKYQTKTNAKDIKRNENTIKTSKEDETAKFAKQGIKIQENADEIVVLDKNHIKEITEISIKQTAVIKSVDNLKIEQKEMRKANDTAFKEILKRLPK